MNGEVVTIPFAEVAERAKETFRVTWLPTIIPTVLAFGGRSRTYGTIDIVTNDVAAPWPDARG